MKRPITMSIVSILLMLIIGCGEEESGTPAEPIIVKGLSGDTYFNTKFGVKIEGLPVDTWTVKALGQDGQGIREQNDASYVPMYHLLLMEPVPEDQFIGLSQEGSLETILESRNPFIWIGLDYSESGNFETYHLSEDLDSYAEMKSAEIESKQMVSIGNATGIQAVLDRGDWKEALTWFAKGEICVRCEYCANEQEFLTYYPVYLGIMENVWLMGK